MEKIKWLKMEESALNSSNPFLVGLGFALPFFVLVLLYFIIVGIVIMCAECQEQRRRRRGRRLTSEQTPRTSRDHSFKREFI